MREDRHPVLEDTGYSGFDDVYYIYRDAYYADCDIEDWDEYIETLSLDTEETEPEEAELIIAKSKILETRTVPLIFDPKTIQFYLI